MCPRFEDAAGWRDRLSTVTAAPADRGDLSAALIRPDGIVAWAAAPGCPRTPQLWRPRCAPGSENRTHV
ncbi:aromatic-ring hydroxylase C-terminal domain-containing protein [Saccharothrix sp. ST-888]|uniref:aromatic-ring hydroxylase C-terminal domain-containing protein n=1 Tax=Saccharothrix sp. ST-888 TaxID=1427391 RepID=UPI003FA69FC6